MPPVRAFTEAVFCSIILSRLRRKPSTETHNAYVQDCDTQCIRAGLCYQGLWRHIQQGCYYNYSTEHINLVFKHLCTGKFEDPRNEDISNIGLKSSIDAIDLHPSDQMYNCCLHCSASLDAKQGLKLISCIQDLEIARRPSSLHTSQGTQLWKPPSSLNTYRDQALNNTAPLEQLAPTTQDTATHLQNRLPIQLRTSMFQLKTTLFSDAPDVLTIYIYP